MTRGDTGGVAAIAIPLALLILLGGIIVVWDPGQLLTRGDAPPVEELTIDRTTLREGEIVLRVTNEGPDPIRISQVLVDEAYWDHTVEPSRTLERLDRATVTIPYPWVEGDAHEVVLVTSSGVTFEHEIDPALVTPVPDAGTFGTYALIGLFVGVLPIAAGIAWHPAIRKAGRKFEVGILAFTIGLLGFLIVESLEEGLELAARAPGPLGGPGLVLLGVVAAMGVLVLVDSQLTGDADRSSTRGRLVTAYMIATGIGLHNLGEGLAIGAAYALGEVALGSFLILGFALHNVTEGPAIVAPMRARAGLWHLGALALLAGAPTILGAWIGGFAFSPMLGAIFFALGAGAMAQVVVDVFGTMRADGDLATTRTPLVLGLVLGVAVMWGTGLLL